MSTRHHPGGRASVMCQLLLALSAAAPTLPALGAQPAGDLQRRDYQIPAGALGSALNRFASEAGVALVFEPAEVAGRAAPALQGQFTVEEGFARLLRGSGLRAIARPDGSWTLDEAPVEAGTLSAIQVEDSLGEPEVTEDSGSYTTPATSAATGLSLSLRETPQSMTVVTRQRMDDQNMATFDDMVRNTTGLYMTNNGIGGDDHRYRARGFAISNLKLDGVAIALSEYGAASMPPTDLAIYDRAEVVRGATGLTDGAGDPSASINLVRKRPRFERAFELDASAGSWKQHRLMGDFSTPLNEAGTVRARVVGSWQDRDSFIDVTNFNSRMLYGILEADLGENLTAAVGISDQRNRTNGLFVGQPSNNDGSLMDLPRSYYLGTDWSYSKRDSQALFGDLTYRLANDWQARLSASRTRSDVDFYYPFWNTRTDWDEPFIATEAYNYRYGSNDVSGDLTLRGPFQLFGRQHQAVFGYSQRRNTAPTAGYTGVLDAPVVIDVRDPADFLATPRPAIDASNNIFDSESRTIQKGAYAATQLALTGRLKLIAGGRLSWYDYERDRGGEPDSQYAVEGEFTPYGGIVFDLHRSHSAYASYTRIFQPQNALDAAGDLLPPVKGTNLEAGLKGEYFDGALNGSAALFQVRQTNRAVTDETGPSPCPGTGDTFCQRAAGEIRSEGWEIELSGALRPGWEMALGFTHVATRYESDSIAANVGRPVDTNYPRDQFRLSTQYRFGGMLQGWRIGGSAYAQGAVYQAGEGYRIEQDAYVVMGANLGYRINSRFDAQLDVNNLLDKKYLDTIGFLGQWYAANNWYAAPRNVLLSLRTSW